MEMPYFQWIHEDSVQEGHKYPGSRGEYTEKLSFLLPSEYNGIPVYRVLDHDGRVIDPAHDPNIDAAELVRTILLRCKDNY